jgi:predicted HicB family RNase H-like nuclease
MSRPAKLPRPKRRPEDQVMTSLRVTERVRRQIEAAAKANKRSFNSEVNYRLAQTLGR